MKKIVLFFVYLLFFQDIRAQNLHNIADSLEKIMPSLTAKQQISNYIDLCWTVRHFDAKKAINYARKAIHLAQKLNEKELEADAYNRLGVCYRNQLEGVKAVLVLDSALKIAQKAGSLKQMAYAYNNIGSVYGNLILNENLWLENSHKSVAIFTKIKDYTGVANSLRYVAMAHNNSKNYDSAIFYAQKAIEISKEHQLWNDYMRSFIYLATIYRDIKQDELLKINIENAFYISEKHNIPKTMIWAMYVESLFKQKKYDSTSYYLNFLEKSKEVSNNNILWIYNYSADIALIKKDSTKAIKYLLGVRTILDSLYKNDKQKLLADHALLQKQKEVESNQFEILRNEQNEYLYVFGLIAMILVAVLLFYNSWKGRKFNQMLNLKNEELNTSNEELNTSNEEFKQNNEELQQTLELVFSQRMDMGKQKKIIEEKNKDIIASINYALRIQNAIMPTEQDIQKYFPESFVLFMPKDIVSGDFYWFADKIDKKIIVVADCTGHGVSGAFMTMIGNNILNQIIHDYEIHAPDEILNQMPIFLEKTLSHSEGKVKDGMDISIITIHKSVENSENITTKIEYAGAMNPLYYVQNQDFTEIKADKMPIGGNHKNEDFDYQKHEIIVQQKTTTFYLCTDGYQDQFGGKDGKKFMVKKLRNLLFDISEKPMSEQKEILSQNLANWIAEGNEKQIDDITILGIRI